MTLEVAIENRSRWTVDLDGVRRVDGRGAGDAGWRIVGVSAGSTGGRLEIVQVGLDPRQYFDISTLQAHFGFSSWFATRRTRVLQRWGNRMPAANEMFSYVLQDILMPISGDRSSRNSSTWNERFARSHSPIARLHEFSVPSHAAHFATRHGID